MASVPCFTLSAAESGNPAPECTLSTFDAQQAVNIQGFQGQVLYVDFWASWCGPCAKSFPFLNKMHHELKDKGLQIVGVNLDENLEDAKGFLAKYPADFTVVTDPGEQCAKRFDVKAMPSSYLIDRKGIVRHVHLGFRSGESEDLRLLIEQLLAETSESH